MVCGGDDGDYAWTQASCAQYAAVESLRRAARCEVVLQKLSEAHTCTPHSNTDVGRQTRAGEGQHRSDHLGVGRVRFRALGNKHLSCAVVDMDRQPDHSSGMLGVDHGRRQWPGGRGEGSSCA